MDGKPRGYGLHRGLYFIVKINMGKKAAAALRWYAVAVGRQQGGFRGWNEGDCAEDKVKGYKGQVDKSFDSEEEAKGWLRNQMEKNESAGGGEGKAETPEGAHPTRRQRQNKKPSEGKATSHKQI